jgi:hypothetical protein
MQWLVYVHNNGDTAAAREAGAVLGDAPTVPLGDEPTTYARVWVDSLASDIAAEIRKVVGQLFADYPPLEGVPGTHMTEMATVEVCTGPEFQKREAIEQALLGALVAAEADAA